MTDTKKTNELNRLDDAMLEDILSLTDEEVESELADAGIELDQAASEFESALDGARMRSGLDELASARVEFMADQRRREAKTRQRSPNEARALLARLEAEMPELTKAARNADGSNLSDREALAQLDDVMELLEDLGEMDFDLDGDR